MANPKPDPKPAQHAKHLVARTRKAILNAFDAVENRGKVISDILADEFENNPLKFMDMAAKYIPKNIDIEVTHNGNADKLTDAELADIIAKRARAKHIEGQCIEIDTPYKPLTATKTEK